MLTVFSVKLPPVWPGPVLWKKRRWGVGAGCTKRESGIFLLAVGTRGPPTCRFLCPTSAGSRGGFVASWTSGTNRRGGTEEDEEGGLPSFLGCQLQMQQASFNRDLQQKPRRISLSLPPPPTTPPSTPTFRSLMSWHCPASQPDVASPYASPCFA